MLQVVDVLLLEQNSEGKICIKVSGVVLLHFCAVGLAMACLVLSMCCWTVLVGHCDVHSGYSAACSDTESH